MPISRDYGFTLQVTVWAVEATTTDTTVTHPSNSIGRQTALNPANPKELSDSTATIYGEAVAMTGNVVTTTALFNMAVAPDFTEKNDKLDST